MWPPSLRAYAGCDGDPVSGYLAPSVVRQMEEAVLARSGEPEMQKQAAALFSDPHRLLARLKPPDFPLTLTKLSFHPFLSISISYKIIFK